MVWHFEGTGLDITLGTTRSGTFRIRGNGVQTCRPPGGDHRVIELVKGLDGLFTINSSTAEPTDYDGAGFGLKEFYEEEPNQPATMIVYHGASSGSRAAIGASIIVPSDHMLSMVEIGKLLIGHPDLRYVTTIGFFGLAVENANTDTPTYKQFTSETLTEQRAYFSRDVTFNVLPKERHR
jgi:hypothetical protein